jgi:hypothetical protein
LEEKTICPIDVISATETSYVITGKRNELSGLIARLTVDLTIEPPIATYSEVQG